ncbi:hypothetical protein [Streptomyces sp. STCH 565 A]|uniref:hypothetical protein n=1 Tax=Streptomyces sp. STCH 565 A TaxID=2950532 RepID=UPI002074D2F4|nr:hypothetical protein [Streptomyces sp. STCH 565 A]MCM8552264.1 hypothetical protein [Streptomyces sp. STCH 565 A]
MSPARRTAAACYLGAGISTLSAVASLAWHPWLAIPGLAGAAFLVWGAASAQDAGDRRANLHERLHDAAASDAALLDPNQQPRSAA